ncbi:PREDICTED: uncharacterized protein LOC108370042 [Rhagoletis zephyria]|uniref:uncharacterized protein LOC108370042 n=1 Tax=Rhagoletis zephyria TaxID=28612 RepID=UPI0008117EF8|nr:PREDICTED: uncharacterized protein LOC108370042 [Rhagoletis zephyria]
MKKQQRSIMKRNITNMKSKVEKEGDNADSITLECRLQILESHFKQISHIQGQIEKISPDDNARSDIEESYIEIKGKIMRLLNKGRRPSLAQASFGNASTSHSFTHQSRLPTLKLPKFDAKYAEYKRFSHTFANFVNDDPTIPTIEKFNYLINCLSGQALAIVEPFQITENYPKALARLKERYDNNVLIFLDYISSLFALQAMPKADATALRIIIDKVSALRSSLPSLGPEIDILNSIIIHIVLSKVDTG